MSLSMNSNERHPCFNVAAKGRYGRVHLPVAPTCNIKCNFCNRRYDCVNESRPGVTSGVLTPEQALRYLDQVRQKEPRISVAGIAGPGDPFATGELTMATLEGIRRTHPDLILCLSSNGMGIGPYVDDLAKLGVSHVTITVCAVDVEVAAAIYSWVCEDKIVYRGTTAARLLLTRQMNAIAALKQHDITVKVNCIVIPQVNDHHVEAVAREMKGLGVDLFNCMALFPASGTVFADLEQPDPQLIEQVRRHAEKHLPQMRHCTRCRADAVGLLNEDRTDEFRGCLKACSEPIGEVKTAERRYVAVASEEGILVNQHLGEARLLRIWEQVGDGFREVEERPTPAAGSGIRRWHQVARTLADCRAVLVGGIGTAPREVLEAAGFRVVVAAGFIEDGLRVVYENRTGDALKGRRQPVADGRCSGSGAGCGG